MTSANRCPHALEPDVRRVLEGTPLAHLATVLPDGSPHSVPLWIHAQGNHVVILTSPRSRKARNLRHDPRVAISLAPVEDPYSPICIRGRVIEWLTGERAWKIVDQISDKYTGAPYSRDRSRIVALIRVSQQTVGIG